MTRKIRPAHLQDEPVVPAARSSAPGTHPLVAAALVSLLATLASHTLPLDFASAGVALVFLGATYLLCLRVGHEKPPSYYGLSLGGLMEPNPLSLARLTGDALRALGVATLVALLVLPPFWWGFVHYNALERAFDFERAFTWEGSSAPAKWLVEMTLWHVLGVALPEEAFFRGYLQTSLRERWTSTLRLGPLGLNWSIVIVSVFFALGHLATDPHPARLAVFFPSLLFGVVRRTTGGIGAAVFLHAECNLFSQWLGQGYGLY